MEAILLSIVWRLKKKLKGEEMSKDWKVYLNKTIIKKYGFVKHYRKNEVVAYFNKEGEAKYSFLEEGIIEEKIRTVSKDMFLNAYEEATPSMYEY